MFLRTVLCVLTLCGVDFCLAGEMGCAEKSVQNYRVEKVSDGLYFQMIPITAKNAQSWCCFSDAVTSFIDGKDVSEALPCYQNIREALPFFKDAFVYFSDSGPSAQLWVSLFSSSPLQSTPDNQLVAAEYRKIEMAITISSELDAMFSVHMGIFRNPYYDCTFSEGRVTIDNSVAQHKGLSVLLHQFSAKYINTFLMPYMAEKKYIVSTPTSTMRDILIKSLQGAGFSYSAQDNLASDFWDCKKGEKRRLSIASAVQGCEVLLSPVYIVFQPCAKFGWWAIRFLKQYYEPGQFLFIAPDNSGVWDSDPQKTSWWLVKTLITGCEIFTCSYAELLKELATFNGEVQHD